MKGKSSMAEPEQEKMQFLEFLMETPPGKRVIVENLASGDKIQKPPIVLYCNNAMCHANMYFDCVDEWAYAPSDEWRPCSLLYQCRHCKDTIKWIAFLVYRNTYDSGIVIKFGENPPFGPHTPARVISLVEEDRELFLKGRQSEARGLGIGAFAYYRRVVDNNWQRLLDEVIKVAKKLNLPTEVLEKAKAEHQFKKAVKMVKDAIPQVLLVNGQNPITILYKILSVGVHELTDDRCLELAKHIRVVLVDFTDRVGEALRERQELQDSLTKLYQLDKPQEPAESTDSQEDDNQDAQQEKPQQ